MTAHDLPPGGDLWRAGAASWSSSVQAAVGVQRLAGHLLREGDYMIGCGHSQGLREIYQEKKSFEESYARSEVSDS